MGRGKFYYADVINEQELNQFQYLSYIFEAFISHDLISAI